MLFGQRADNDKIVVSITLIHQEGHEETREYAVRAGATNRMKDATSADAGAATTAWRHLVIKMFGLKSRIVEGDDPRNLGEHVTPEQAEELERRVNELNFNRSTFFKLAGAGSFGEIPAGSYPVLDQCLRMKEHKGK